MSSQKTVTLSKEQIQAIESEDSRLTVHAAAGSGKTRVLVESYLRHVTQNGVSPDQILTITFTKKAAAEMKRRIVNSLIEQGHLKEAQIAETGPIQTIHSFCEKSLRENALLAAIDPEFQILSEAQSQELFEQALQKSLTQLQDTTEDIEKLITQLAGKFEYNAPRTLHSKLSSSVRKVLHAFRGSGHQPDQLLLQYKSQKDVLKTWNIVADSETVEEASFTSGLMQLALATWKLMEEEMHELQVFDFTLMEALTVQLIHNSKSVQERLQSQYRIMLIDEAQDVNPVQYKLIESLELDCHMMVGDPQQSIYGFRQADPKLFLSKLETTQSLKLSQNYRSTEGVLSFIDYFFQKIWTDYQPMSNATKVESDDSIFGSTLPTPSVIDCAGVELWEQNIKDHGLTAHWISQLLDEGHQPSDIAILVRHSYFANELSETLHRQKIPHHIVGGSEKFYTRLEIRDIANALQAIADPYNDFAILCLLHSPIVGLSMDSIVLLANIKPIIKQLPAFRPENLEDKERLEDFLIWFTPLCLHASRLPAWEILSEIICRSGYFEQLAMRPNGHQLIANVRKIFYLATQEPHLLSHEFAERIRYIQQIHHREGDAASIDENDNFISIMTIHKSKGLEFPVVILPDMHYKLNRAQQDILCSPKDGMVITKFSSEVPEHYRLLDKQLQQTALEEELRVLYVAMTRAKEKLCISTHSQGSSLTLAGFFAKTLDLKNHEIPGIRMRSYKL